MSDHKGNQGAQKSDSNSSGKSKKYNRTKRAGEWNSKPTAHRPQKQGNGAPSPSAPYKAANDMVRYLNVQPSPTEKFEHRLGGPRIIDDVDETVEDLHPVRPALRQYTSIQNLIKNSESELDVESVTEVGNARLKGIERYLAQVDSTRKHHPLLQHKDKFDLIANAMRQVNGQKTALVSVDIEAFERNTNIVTEIGISIYDPLREALSMVPTLLNIHILLKESLKLRNGSFVRDHKDNFLGGNSIILDKSSSTKMIQEVIDFYFISRKSRGFQAAFVGHNVSGDLKWLKSLGVSIPADHKIIDTERVYVASHGSQQTSLGGILKRLNIPHSFLHNAGNDAYYTLIALLKLTDTHTRKVRHLDNHEKDIEYDEYSKQQIADLKEQQAQPKKLNRAKKAFKSHEFSPHLEYSSYKDALVKVFEYY